MLSLLSKADESLDIKLLVLNPELGAAEYWANETPGYIDTIKSAIARLTKIAKLNPSMHDEKSRFRVYIFDDTMYLGFRLKMEGKDKENHCVNLPIWKVSAESHLYKAFSQQFDDLWEKYSAYQHKTICSDNKEDG